MKKVMNWWLMAAVVLGLSLSVTSCKDDDDKNGEEQRSDIDPLDNDEARTAFRWLCALTNETTLDQNWKSKQYEVVVGLASESEQNTRVVVVSDLDEAKAEFGSLSGKDPSELAGKVTVDGGAAGKMTWEPSAAGAQNLAVVTVNSKLFPNLQKLVYCTSDQTGLNASIRGTAYYRFGDVIQDPDGYYWVCVRPSFADPTKKVYKDDSHWINIFNAAPSGGEHKMPAANVYDKYDNVAKYKYQTIKLPTCLAYDRQHIYNLSQLIWALINPDDYQSKNQGVSKALGGFTYTYHGRNFIDAVAQYWNEKSEGDNYTIWQKLFNHTYEEMKQMKQIHFFYQGYSWKWGNSGYCWRYSSTGYDDNGYDGSDSDDKEEFDFVDRGFDITYYAHDSEKALPMDKFTTDNNGKHVGTWVIRYMRGDKLMTGGKYNVYAKITSKVGQVKDVYRFNQKRGIDAGENVTPLRDTDIKNNAKVYEGNFIGSDGQFYAKVADMYNGVTPVAIVCRVSNTPLEVGTEYNALAMAYNVSPTDSYAWGGNDDDCSVTTAHAGEGDVLPTILNGIAATQALVNGCGKKHDHEAAKFCNNYTCALSEARRQTSGFSKWFLPSLGQWIEAARGLGMGEWKDNYGYALSGNYLNDVVKPFLSGVGADLWYDNFYAKEFWTSTTLDKTNACTFTLKYMFASNKTPRNEEKTSKQVVIPFIAFKVKQ